METQNNDLTDPENVQNISDLQEIYETNPEKNVSNLSELNIPDPQEVDEPNPETNVSNPSEPIIHPKIHPKIQELKQKLDYLEQYITLPAKIELCGIQNLKKETGKNWEDRLMYLMFSAHIPLGWILDTVPENDIEPNVVQLTFISNHVKQRVVNILNEYLNNDYDNTVYIE